MKSSSKTAWTKVFFILLVAGLLGLSMVSRTFAANPGDDEKSSGLSRHDIKELQEKLRDKGYYHAHADGVLGPQTRDAIRQYQESEKLPSTGRLDAETSGKLGVGQESVGGDFKRAGHDVGSGGKGFGHEIKKGKPVTAGKDLGVGVGRGGKEVGKGVKEAVTP
jgi:peptidoglycan hydrolase-like protein with peptidoglycan-binding domain